MISLDSSVIPAIIIFLCLVTALNYLLFQPLMRIQAQRANLTTASMAESRKKLDFFGQQMERYHTAIRNGRMEAYRNQEQVRSDATKRRADALARARVAAEQLVRDAQAQLNAQVTAAKVQLSAEARDLALGIAAARLHRLLGASAAP